MRRKNLSKILSLLIIFVSLASQIISVQAHPIQQDDTPEVPEAEEFTGEPTPEPVEDSDVIITEEPPFQITEKVEENPYFSVEKLIYDDGTIAESAVIAGPPEPPPGYDREVPMVVDYEAFALQEGILGNMPSFDWVFGCSAVSGGMIAGYYDRTGYPNMYAGRTNGGLMPLSDKSWPIWYSPIADSYDPYPNNPLIASHKGIDGRTTRGSIDDYWWAYGSTRNDPYLVYGWAQHTWGTAIGDYMKTSRSLYNITDGGTRFYYTTSGDGTLTCQDMVNYGLVEDGTLGRRAFYQKRGYKVSECYSQLTDNYHYGGFSFEDYKREIDAGHPVFINVKGHSMVGYGYGTGTTIYIRNTWDNDPNHIYTMQWGGSYYGMELYQVSIVKPQKPLPPIPRTISPIDATPTHKPTYIWSKIAGATNYNVEVFKGSVKIFSKTVTSSVCGPTGCRITPANSLPDDTYLWRVRAKVGGIWRPFSKFVKFVVSTNFVNEFSTRTELALWKTVMGPWALKNDFYISPGYKDRVNSIAHHGLYPTFTYIVRMKRIGDPDDANMLYVRGNPYPLSLNNRWDNGYIFQYANNGQFSVFRSYNGSYTPIKFWTSSAAINKYGPNILKVTGDGSKLRFYINGKIVWLGDDALLPSGSVGIGFYKDGDFLGEPLLVDRAILVTRILNTTLPDEWAEMGEPNYEWSDINIAPPVPETNP